MTARQHRDSGVAFLNSEIIQFLEGEKNGTEYDTASENEAERGENTSCTGEL